MQSCNSMGFTSADSTPTLPNTTNTVESITNAELSTSTPPFITETATAVHPPATFYPSDISPEYFDGVVAITQYYTFLGHNLHEEAFQILSQSAKIRARGAEEYVSVTKTNFKRVEIISVQPYFIAIEQQGGQPKTDPDGKWRFAVQIRAWGEGNMSGSRVNGEKQDLFLELILEEGFLKIDKFATAPFP